MRKIILIFIMSFLFIIRVNALEKFYLGEKITGMYIEVVDGNNFYNGPGTVLYKENGEYVYCINPFLAINTENYYSEYDDSSLFNLTDDQIKRINLLSYFGYGYGSHNEMKWYGITQFLIWKTVTNGNVYFTDKYKGSRIEAYLDEINEIESLINNYLTLPSFANNEFKHTINSNYEIVDSNNVLNSYSILESDIDALIENNKLIINTKEEGNYQIKFNKKIDYNNTDTHLYYLSGYQNLISPGSINDIEFILNIEVKSGSIIINKLDSENISRREATLFKAKYGIYKDDELIDVVETDKLGKAYINNLPLGKYYVKEIEPSTGYNIDNNIYEIVLDYDENEKEINSLEEVIYGNLIINKYYGGNGVYHVEEESVFEIYDVNNNLIDSLLASSGSNSIKLEYGNYLIHQKKGISGYKFVDDFNLFINSNDDYIFDLYDELIVDVPNTFKISNNIYLSIVLISIGILLIIKSKIKIKA